MISWREVRRGELRRGSRKSKSPKAPKTFQRWFPPLSKANNIATRPSVLDLVSMDGMGENYKRWRLMVMMIEQKKKNTKKKTTTKTTKLKIINI